MSSRSPFLRTAILGSTLLTVACGRQPALDRAELDTFLSANGWSPAALADGATILWQHNVGKGHSAVVAAGDLLYTMGNEQQGQGKGAVFRDVVTCLEATTGAPRWRYTYPCDDIYFPGPRATPVVAGDNLYTLSWQGHLHCLDRHHGELIWSRQIVDEGLAKPGHWGLAGSPVVDGDRLVVTAGSAGAAFDRHTGELLWHSEPVETSLPTPLLLSSGEQGLVAVAGEGMLHAVAVATGEVRWSHPWDSEYFLAPALIGGRLLLPGTQSSSLLELGSGQPQEVLESQVRFSAFQSYEAFEGYVYGFVGRSLQCVDLATGKRRWRTKIGANGALSEADGMLIILTGSGRLVIAPASPAAFTPLESAQVLTLQSNQGVPQPKQQQCWTRPVLYRGRVYVRCNHGNLVCVDLTG